MKAKLNLYRKFVEEELIPLEPLLLNHHYDELYNKLEEKRKKVKKLGLWAPYLSKKYGGQNMSFLDFVSIDEINQSTGIIFQLIDINKDNKISLLELKELKGIIEILK